MSHIKYSKINLIQAIDDYISDKDYKYAIALVGAWGSGKTRFLEERVRSYLEEKNICYSRISMFGVSNADELYERIAMELIPTFLNSNVKDDLIKGMGKGVIANILSIIGRRVGISINLSASMQTIVKLMLGNDNHKRLLVLDDVERRSEKSDELSLFGAINDLVEGLNNKVILVTNSLNGKLNSREFDINVREKLVWKVYSFHPSCSELAKDILVKSAQLIDNIDLEKAIINGAEMSNCSNARAMIKAAPLIKQICRSEILQDEHIALLNRISALQDAVQFSLLVCMNQTPEKQKAPKNDNNLNEFENYLSSSKLFEKYEDFTFIKDYFNSSYFVTFAEIDSAFRKYINKQYPHNESTLAIYDIYSHLETFSSLEDEDIVLYAEKFCSVIAKADFSVNVLRSVLDIYYTLSYLGFICYITEDTLKESCFKAIIRDPYSAYDGLRKLKYFYQDEDDSRKNVICYLQNELETFLLNSSTNELSLNGEDSATKLVELLTKLMNNDQVILISNIDADIIANIFQKSSASDQEELRKCFVRLNNFMSPNINNRDKFINWVKEIISSLNKNGTDSRMRTLRKKWMLNNLDTLLKSLG